ncbi:MAG: hypothetical protein ACFFCX_17640 [Candidatus Sifarchaeia archaeon]
MLIYFALGGLIIGGILGYLIKPTAEILEVDVTKYELQNEIQRLEYEAKIKAVEIRYLEGLHFIENADSTQLDSLWANHGF